MTRLKIGSPKRPNPKINDMLFTTMYTVTSLDPTKRLKTTHAVIGEFSCCGNGGVGDIKLKILETNTYSMMNILCESFPKVRN